MNDKLAQVIANKEIPLDEKFKQMDAMLKDGAQMSGSGGKYGENPTTAAFSSNDVALMKALVARGLKIDNAERCDAQSVVWSALRPNGDVMLQYLLENGLSLACLQTPPLNLVLGQGIATKDYPVDQAIAVARILVPHGADVTAKDGQGRTVFDVLAPGDATRIAPLHAYLVEALQAKQTLEGQPLEVTDAGSAADEPAESLTGSWTGLLIQSDGGRFTMVLTFSDSGEASVVYPELRCRERLLPQGGVAGALKYLARASGSCVDGGTILLSRVRNVLRSHWSKPGMSISAQATLAQVP